MDKNSKKIIALNTQLTELVKTSRELDIPLTIAQENGNDVETHSNDLAFSSENFFNIKMLNDEKGDLVSFLLAISQAAPLELNIVKCPKSECDFTLTNQQVLTTQH